MRRFGLFAGLFLVIAIVAAAFTYPLVATARDDKGFCLSCHVMKDAGKEHAASYHREVATCSDCHVGSLAQKYTDGARHVAANIAGVHSDAIALREASKEIVARQCFSCHAELSLHARTKESKNENCLGCHQGHKRRAIDLLELPGQKKP